MLREVLYAGGLAGLAIAAPQATATASSTQSQTQSTDACGQIAALSAVFVAATPSATPLVPADLALECLQAIPYNESASSELLDSIEPYLNWQTTLSRLGNPPEDYAENVQAQYDFYQAWSDIRANLSNYQSQYDFGLALYQSFQRAHDGHFVFYPFEVNGILSFKRTTPLVSISVDGVCAPQPYLYSDIVAAGMGDDSFEPSAIVAIDGQDVTEFLEDWASHGSLQDPDALYNNLFYIPAQIALGPDGTGVGTFAGGSRGRWVYPGPETTLTFANGSCLTSQNYGRVLADFTGVKTGADLYAKYLTYDSQALEDVFEVANSTATASATAVATTSAEATSTAAPLATPMPGYPTPLYKHSQNFDSSYFLQGDGYEDVVVIAANSFVGDSGQAEFQQVIQDTLAAAQQNGKTKLIIDVSANGGGTILLGYDFFTQLFPEILPYGGSRYRAHETFDLLGQTVSELTANVPRSLNDSQTELDLISSSWDYRTDADVDYEPFDSWADKYGPHELRPLNDNFTSIIRWNLSDPLIPEDSGGIYVSGYLDRSNITVSSFQPEDIVIVYDGYCASTCTIFSELMRQQAGVKTIALGGRSNTDIIQAVGGVKGSNDLPYSYIFGMLAETFEVAPDAIKETWVNSSVADYNQLFQARGLASVVNARDAFREGDETNTPLQFVYEPADCRILYTADMVIDQSAVWRKVADTVWGGENACVAGGEAFGGSSDKRKRTTTTSSISEDISLQGILDSFGVETVNRPDIGFGVMIV